MWKNITHQWIKQFLAVRSLRLLLIFVQVYRMYLNLKFERCFASSLRNSFSLFAKQSSFSWYPLSSLVSRQGPYLVKSLLMMEIWDEELLGKVTPCSVFPAKRTRLSGSILKPSWENLFDFICSFSPPSGVIETSNGRSEASFSPDSPIIGYASFNVKMHNKRNTKCLFILTKQINMLLNKARFVPQVIPHRVIKLPTFLSIVR